MNESEDMCQTAVASIQQILMTEPSTEAIELRPARKEDCQLLWEWTNDPGVRAVSFASEPIPWERHVQWFESKINDANCIIYLAANSEGTLIGQVRYDISGDKATISVVIDPEFRGKGYGSEVIRLASQRLLDVSDVASIHAYVKQGNVASVRGFMKADYKDQGIAIIQGHEALHFVLERVVEK